MGVIPAKAGIQFFSRSSGCRIKSGMTKGLNVWTDIRSSIDHPCASPLASCERGDSFSTEFSYAQIRPLGPHVGLLQ